MRHTGFATGRWGGLTLATWCWARFIPRGREATGRKGRGELATEWCGALAPCSGWLDPGHLPSGSAKDIITGAAVTTPKA